MIYDRFGKILWHRGRNIIGNNVFDGHGFCKSYIEQSLQNFQTVNVGNCIKSKPENLSQSAVRLLVKSVVIHPVSRRSFLYMDSGAKESFSQEDRDMFKILGKMLEETLGKVQGAGDVFGLTGSSDVIEELREIVAIYSLEDEPVLLSGETGVGKNKIALSIHHYSGKKGKYVIVDTPNISTPLFESILFGHKKGAFTDARFDKTGLVEEARGGTLFFDEISEVPLDIQSKLLRFIDTQKYYRLGESQEREAQVRIIAATNRDLGLAVANQQFRKDLFYRLNVLGVNLPPLRDRPSDIKDLVKANIELLRGKELGEGFWDVMLSYNWPGNVRELLNILKRAGIILSAPVTGVKISGLLNVAENDKVRDSNKSDSGFRDIRDKIDMGGDFWSLVWRPFIDREMDRNRVKGILKGFYSQSDFNFKKMIKILNIDASDYQKFMSLVYKYKIDPRK